MRHSEERLAVSAEHAKHHAGTLSGHNAAFETFGFVCSQGHQFDLTFSAVKSGCWCPACVARAKSNERMSRKELKGHHILAESRRFIERDKIHTAKLKG